jgi:hypothetical protein
MPNKSLSPIVRKENKGRFYTKYAHSRESKIISIGTFTDDKNNSKLLEGSKYFSKCTNSPITPGKV